MKLISTLGPAGTFTEVAAKKYIDSIGVGKENYHIRFYPTISKAFGVIGNECDQGIIPIENALEGYVQPTLDLLVHTGLKIIREVVIPIRFSFVSNSKSIQDLKRVFVQFQSQGQCSKFLEQFACDQIITTESNSRSYHEALNGIPEEGSVIPRHLLDERNFPYSIEDITDSQENKTRFIVVSKEEAIYSPEQKYKTSLVVLNGEAEINEPGWLVKILKEFSDRKINLTSIMSRTTKKTLGKYHFFMDLEGRFPEDSIVREAIEKINRNYAVKVLGSYYCVGM